MARILIVEDSPANMMLVETLLESCGHTLFQAERAPQALDIARREQLDLILMDIQLPGMDGIEATRILKADPRTSGVPVVALTAFAMKGDRERLLQAGCDGYIEKPINYIDFLAEVAAIIERADPAP
ncbi:response regulator [Janthinobacterium fluminis]|uniref:Response regulator n=1 Tax=Janthinobacterium fluminis TaxID=2987524 RepID=A0ABT5K0N1_9BURK|nr:response regulator [Janthinobacterium fluminis]MDC8758551.1 response regulator [Janthinobacterium fluminis]